MLSVYLRHRTSATSAVDPLTFPDLSASPCALADGLSLGLVAVEERSKLAGYHSQFLVSFSAQRNSVCISNKTSPTIFFA
jgi:hypothetical protein